MRRFILLSIMLFLSISLLIAPTQGQTINEHHFTLYLEDFTALTATQPADLGTPITFGPNRANFFTNPAYNWITLQIGHTAPAEASVDPLIAEALKDEILTGDGDLGYLPATAYTSWRSPSSGAAPVNSLTGTSPTYTPHTNDGKVEILIEPHKLLGMPIFQVEDIVDIRWQTYRVADTSGGNDWYASIWTYTPTPSPHPSPLGGGYTALINFEARYTPPTPLSTGDWIQNSAQLIRPSEHFYAVTQISGVAGVSLDAIRTGAINWDNYTSGSTHEVDYRAHDVKAIAFATASLWGWELDSYLDDLQIDIETSSGNIERIIINLETQAPIYDSIPAYDSTINITTSVGVEATLPITIENIGTQPLSLTNISLDNPAVLEIGYNATLGAPLAPSETFDFNFTCGGAAFTTIGTYTNSVLVEHNGLGASDPAEYIINCTITGSPFTVDSAQTTSGALTNGAIFTVNQDTIAITFTADVFNTTDTTDPNYADSASNPANYVLLQGDAIATTSCNAINPSDTRITAFTVNHDSASRASTLTFAPPLTDGIYRLLVCGTTSIVLNADPSVHLNGGTDVTFNFTINTTPPVGPTPIGPTPTSPTPIPGTGTGALPQPEALNVTELPATGETPAWADLLRWILGW